jgi:hypothetical protein
MRKHLLLGALLLSTWTLPAFAAGVPGAGTQMMQHLEFLGYTCTLENQAQKDKAFVLADHTDEYRFTFRKLAGGIVFRVLFTLNAEKKQAWGETKVLQAINQANAEAALLKVYLFEDGETLALEAWQADTYEKQSFAAFIALYRSEIQTYVVESALGDVID